MRLRDLASLLALSLSACELAPVIEPPPCPDVRAGEAGVCCDALESPIDDSCAPRAFSEPHSPGDQGVAASALAIAVDGGGRALLAWSEADRVVVMEDVAGALT